jgi:hypothetical protein
MKKYLPYILGMIGLVLLIVLMATTAKKSPKKIDNRITLRQQDKIPYGSYVARNLLPALYANASIIYDRKEPGYWWCRFLYITWFAK